MNSLYTLAFDPPGKRNHALMAKLLVGSLQRTFFTGDIVIFRNTPEPIFLSQRQGVEEVFLPESHEGWAQSMEWKWKVLEKLEVEKYHHILYVDCDCLALRNLDHLCAGDWDFFYQPEANKVDQWTYNCFLTDDMMQSEKWRHGANGGTVGFRGSKCREIVRKWGEIAQCLPEPGRTAWGKDQAALNRLIIDAPKYGWRRRAFERGEIQFPLLHNPHWRSYMTAALLHAATGEQLNSPEKKLQFLYGIFVQRFLYRGDAGMIDLFEP